MLPIRRVARVIMVDAAGAVLLCRYAEVGERGVVSYWVPPGGALEPGEDYRAAAAREVQEETGLAVAPGAELWEPRFEFFMQGRAVDQIERYFVVRLPSAKPAVNNASTEDIQELRWWSRDELRAGGEKIYPDGLLERLPDLLIEAGPE
jgi:8-oxo-dGTP pyrophosphatase MutT (NUDIX family)